MDPELGNAGDYSAFSDKAVRLGFIRKVYGILCVQLVITFGFVFIATYSHGVQGFIKGAPGMPMLIGCVVVSLVSLITLFCCGVHRQYPMNFVCLGIFTIAESFVVGVAGALSEPRIVLMAVVATAIIVIGLTIFAFQTKIDFTVFSGLMFCVLLGFIVLGFLKLCFPQNETMEIVYCGFGAIIFSAYIVIDTQMIVGGSHKYQISPEDYVYGAITLYLDIINLFLYILRILNAAKS